MQDDERFFVVFRYVERNALRAGLVKRAEDCRWGSLWRWMQKPERNPKLPWPWPWPRRLERMARWVGTAIHHDGVNASHFATKSNAPQFTGKNPSRCCLPGRYFAVFSSKLALSSYRASINVQLRQIVDDLHGFQ